MYANCVSVEKLKRGPTIAVCKEIGTCPSTTILYSLGAGAPKLTILNYNNQNTLIFISISDLYIMSNSRFIRVSLYRCHSSSLVNLYPDPVDGQP